MYVVPYIERGLDSASITEPFPNRSIAAHLYVGRPTFEGIPKAEPYRAFFVTRDPRDIVVSFYFAAKHSHKPIGEIPALRAQLEGLDEVAGMNLIIDTLDGWGLFRAQHSWGPPTDSGEIPVYRYEDLAADHRVFLRGVFSHLEIPLSDSEFEEICVRKSFSAVSGREKGSEDVNAHLRRGTPGEWHDRLAPDLVAKIDEITDGLPSHLGY
jgi:hypothetical protein